MSSLVGRIVGIVGSIRVAWLSSEFYVWSFFVAVVLVYFDFTVHVYADGLVAWRFYFEIH